MNLTSTQAEQIVSIIQQIFDLIAGVFGETINWTTENILPVVEEYIAKYQTMMIWEYVFGLAICGVLFIASNVCIHTLWGKNIGNSFSDGECIGNVIAHIVAIIAFIMICVFGYKLIEVYNFPELVAYDKFIELIEAVNK